MPIYEYECSNCQHHFDLIQKISDVPAEECPQCFKNTAKRLISAAGFQLKGSGWYQTDFKNKGKPPVKKEAQASKGEKKTPDSSSAAGEVKAKSEAKPKKEGDKT